MSYHHDDKVRLVFRPRVDQMRIRLLDREGYLKIQTKMEAMLIARAMASQLMCMKCGKNPRMAIGDRIVRLCYKCALDNLLDAGLFIEEDGEEEV